ncbi:MAG TPA: hypothetical protein VMT31_07835 [Methanomicrobiales archaeon]|jgi:hypothetical protein|nr:hypothetical protein [Methanomicrobiales archaeon]
MTAEFESIAELLLLILTIVCIVQAVLVGMLLWYVKRVTEFLGSPGGTAMPPPAPPAPAARAPEPTPERAERPDKARAAAASTIPATPAVPASPTVPAVELFGGSPDIQGSIHRLCEKYGLSDFIIATMDGLLVVSLSPGAAEEAARSSELYRRRKKPYGPGVAFLEIDHMGGPMLGIARSDRPLTPDRLREIGEDARKILNWWL